MEHKDQTFVAISDFHSTEWPLKKVKDYYMKEYDIVYILGDAIDRGPEDDGENGISMLLEIMRLSANNVVYVPGNHDDLIYKYMTLKLQGESTYNVKYYIGMNGGSETIKDLDMLYITNKILFIQLYEWLGNLPIQVKHYYDGIEYNLAHAFFNEKLYKANPTYSLHDLYVGENERLNPDQVLWFRKETDSYNPATLPSTNSKMIIGHTPLELRQGVNLNLTNQYHQTVRVICVDGGVTFGNDMLKYVAGHSEEFSTVSDSHKHISSKRRKIDTIRGLASNIRKRIGDFSKSLPDSNLMIEKRDLKEPMSSTFFIEDKINTIIIESLLHNHNSMDEFEYELDNLVSINSQSFQINGNVTGYGIIGRIFNNANDGIFNDLVAILTRTFGNISNDNFKYYFRHYVIKVGVDYIYKEFLVRYNEYQTRSQIEGFLVTEDEEYITTTNGAQDVAINLGSNRIKKYFNTVNADRNIRESFRKETLGNYLVRILRPNNDN